LEHLRPQDAFFLHVDTPAIPQEVSGLALLEPCTSGGTLDAERVVRSISARLASLPRLRQRLAFGPGRWARPAWTDVTDWDARAHVRTVSTASPGGRREIATTVEGLIAEHLDLSRPPWAMYLIEEAERGPVAFVLKLHHTLADGLGAIDLARRLLDPEPDEENRGSRRRGVVSGEAASPRRPATNGALRKAVWTTRGLVGLARAGAAPPTELNGPVLAARAFAFTDVDFEQVQRVRRALGGSLDDVVLTIVGSALCRLRSNEANGVRTLRAMVPISLRGRGDHGQAGNWTSAISVPLPITDMSPADRLAAIHDATTKLKRSPQPAAAAFVMRLVGTRLPPPIHARVSRAMYRGKWFNLIVSTLRGADRPLSLAGAKVTMAYPVLPLAEDVGLTVGAMTWCGRLTFGFTGHAGTRPDPESLALAAQDAMGELVDSACRRGSAHRTAGATESIRRD
jgi:WS/DGAT/MGAT family acyltransferase